MGEETTREAREAALRILRPSDPLDWWRHWLDGGEDATLDDGPELPVARAITAARREGEAAGYARGVEAALRVVRERRGLGVAGGDIYGPYDDAAEIVAQEIARLASAGREEG